MPRVKRPSTPQLVVIGTSAGLATGLLGVGGGIVIVPALVIWLGWQQREAQATSLGAVFFLASYGVIAFALAGRVDALRALLIGVPALFGMFTR